ncbi:hypothetical protein ANN_03942 [Periplaneta americana]|uniref:Protein RFT1 homolog n=1 Tax=Periplaneta americana TaxID=6978 RepID=A0ABQ8T8D8_PERAM|nr:hypothetical protein ANN_03942 [Periplaneta americana]
MSAELCEILNDSDSDYEVEESNHFATEQDFILPETEELETESVPVYPETEPVDLPVEPQPERGRKRKLPASRNPTETNSNCNKNIQLLNKRIFSGNPGLNPDLEINDESSAIDSLVLAGSEFQSLGRAIVKEDAYEEGVYDVVNNLGSIAARFLFRPVEDSAYFYFSQMVTRDIPIKEQNQKHMAESAKVLYEVIRCITCIGLVIVVFGQSYSHLLLFLYGGESLILGPGLTLMLAHCLAVLLIAINGITECYAFATMNTAQLDRYNRIMAVLSVLFLVVAWLLTRLFGGVGFILANCYNMGARIALG